MTPKGNFFAVILGVVVSTVVSFLVASFFIRRKGDVGAEELTEAKVAMSELKNKGKQVSVKKIVVACDAGMGSSAMGATNLRKKVKAANLDIEVTNSSIENIPADADIVITHEALSKRVESSFPSIKVLAIDNFVGTPLYDELVKSLEK
jgi:PTS system mannitol-specific IIC component